MKMSRRAKRMQRQHNRGKRYVAFNLVALMDIFTILVFFLLVNSTDVEVLPSSKGLKLPQSIAHKKPEQTLVIMVNQDDIRVNGQKIVSVASVISSPLLVIAPLKAELDRQSRRLPSQPSKKVPRSRKVTIMGDKTIPFKLLKKIMVTCTRANYSMISLAVLRKTAKQG